MNERYDVIVAGAGLAGSLAAGVAAKSGLKVALLDRNTEPEVGKKTNWGWVCGDAVAKSHIDYISKHTGVNFGFPELDMKVEGVVTMSPDLQTKFQFDYQEGYSLNRPAFERKLRDFAVKNGAEYIPQFEVEAPLIDNNQVVGIFGKDKTKEHKEVRAKLVIDALGVATTLRRKLPNNPYVDKEVSIHDIESTGRYIYSFELDHQDLNYYDERYALIHLNQEMCPGGYGWVFPKSNNRVNIGIGVEKKSLELRNQKLNRKDSLHSLMDDYVKWVKVFKNLKLDNTDGNGKGYWSVAVRRQLPSLVFHGYMGAGDSMAMPNPISAGGIGPALLSGVLSGQNAVRALQNGDVSINSMWQYNVEFNEIYGKKMAGLEVFRIYLQSLNNSLLNYGMRTFVTADEMKNLTYGKPTELSLASKFKVLLKGAENINAFMNLMYVVKKMKELDEVYNKYPKTPQGFEAWRASVDKHIEDAKQKFPANPV